MADKMDIFERRMVNINGDLRERVIYQRHMAEDIFIKASGIIQEELEAIASGILAEDYVLAGPKKNIPNPHYIYSLDVNVAPDASGTRSVGTVSLAWGNGIFDDLQVNNTPTTPLDVANKDYVDNAVSVANEFIELTDTPAVYTGASASGVRVNTGETALEFYDLEQYASTDTLQIVTDRGAVTTLGIQTGGLDVAGNITADASGSIDIGTVILAFNDAHINRVYLDGDPTTGFEAATKDYVDAQAGGGGTGSIRQVVNVLDSVFTSGITAVPHDDTIPQNDEGDEYMTLSITPSSAANKLLIQVHFNGCSTTDNLVVALFQDATANALCATRQMGFANDMYQMTLSYYMTAGTSSSTTFKVRAGMGGGSTTYFNGDNTGRYFGGVCYSSITITEINV